MANKRHCKAIENGKQCTGKHEAKGYCAHHYKQSRLNGKTTACSIRGCEVTARSRGMCNTHYERFRIHGDPHMLLHKKSTTGVCSIRGCSDKHFSKGLCSKHYTRKRKHGDVNFQSRAANGSGYIDQNGYRVIHIDGSPKKLHRVIMEEFLNRKLLKGETVHHRNGDTLDNRITNLELWSSNQPGGQRIIDKIEWAMEIIATYADDIDKLLEPKTTIAKRVIAVGGKNKLTTASKPNKKLAGRK